MGDCSPAGPTRPSRPEPLSYTSSFSFGPYEYLKTLGSGSSSTVVLVRHAATSKLYALKIVPRHFLVENNLLENFDWELRVFESLNHPNICCFHEVLYLRETICIAMEFCSHGDLCAMIARQGAQHEAMARGWFGQLVDAVRYLHSRNICHRDLKLENLLIDESMNLKLCDFGFSHIQTGNSLLKTRCGSPAYIAPELLQKGDYDGRRSDVWSLGVVLYAMCTGAMPWSNDNQIALAAKIREQPISYPTCFARPLRTLLEGMLERDPLKRYTIDQIAAAEWLAQDPPMPHSGLPRGISLPTGSNELDRLPMLSARKPPTNAGLLRLWHSRSPTLLSLGRRKASIAALSNITGC
jgi:serine/threonine protein kinase